MSTYKRPGSKQWWYRFNFGGHRIQASAKTTNRQAAKDIEAAHRLRLAHGVAGIVDRGDAPTFKTFSRLFLDDVELRRPRSLRFYRQQVAYLLAFPALNRANLGDIRAPLVARYIAWRRKSVGIATTNRALATLRRILRLAAERELIAAAPAVKLLPGEKPREFVLSRAQEADYLEGFGEPMRTALVLMLETGMRPGEALALRWADVHLGHQEGPYLAVRRETAKRDKARAIPLSRRAAAALEALDRTGPHVFGERRAQALSRLQKRSRRVRKSLGLPDLVPHSMRHTGLTRLGDAGVDGFTIAKIAGHASVTTTQRYVHPVPESLRRAVERAESLATVLATVGAPKLPRKRPSKAAGC